MTTREALLAMGYREVKEGRWAKPIAYQLFTFEEATNEWTNWFKDVHGNLGRWNSIGLITDADFLSRLKMAEYDTRTNTYSNVDTAFHLSAVDL